MTIATIDHATLVQSVSAGTVQSTHVKGQPGGWAVTVSDGRTERTLIAQRNRHMRVFKRMETLVTYLRDVGIAQFDVDAASYSPQGKHSYGRPDRAEALRKTHEAAAHDKWFREQVEEAVRQADSPDAVWISNEEVEARWEVKRAELMARIAGAKA
jgi:hypothetical protein